MQVPLLLSTSAKRCVPFARIPYQSQLWTFTSTRRFSRHPLAMKQQQTGSAADFFTSDAETLLPPSQRVHILGMGNIGCFIAHSLRGILNPPQVTLLLHNENLYDQWWKQKRRVTLVKHGLIEHAKGFDVSVARQGRWYTPSQPAIASRTSADIANSSDEELDTSTERSNPKTWALDEEPIDNVILTCKATQVEKALKSIAHRLLPTSTIVFLQNGMGIIDEVNEKIFSDPSMRPNYISGITTHGFYRVEPFKAVHTGMGVTALAVTHTNSYIAGVEEVRHTQDETDPSIPTAKKTGDNNYELHSHTSRYLLSLLCRTPALTATALDKTAIITSQLEKLAMNCVINPLTVLFNCKNGDLLQSFNVARMQRLILIEFAAVVRAMPELQGLPGLSVRFSPERLRKLAVGLERTTAENTSSMLQDVLGGRETEIDYINGYIVKKGDELGIRCVANYMVMQAVLAKSRLGSKAAQEVIPFENLEEFL
ncbi:2-dehydropantoate 2-reductase [Ascosphaera apis ARSEF 7405]|uniref:2-dehydropantoate 2-reductase n=1 Tax=Ascosphaera apis ARSEF 7405 TaxID=392613 RepID=A0A162I0A7_9EURO|nr:2-dehydropantoate 2-reductase [Ascosphaera apis ARSEF 7405]